MSQVLSPVFRSRSTYMWYISGHWEAKLSRSLPGRLGARTNPPSASTLVLLSWSPTQTLQCMLGSWISKISSSTSTAPPYHFLGSRAPDSRSYWYHFLVFKEEEVTVSKQKVLHSPRPICFGSLFNRSRKSEEALGCSMSKSV